MHLPLSSNGFRENLDLAIMVLEKNSMCAKSQVLGGTLVPSQQGDWTGCSGTLQTRGLGAELEFLVGRG